LLFNPENSKEEAEEEAEEEEEEEESFVVEPQELINDPFLSLLLFVLLFLTIDRSLNEDELWPLLTVFNGYG